MGDGVPFLCLRERFYSHVRAGFHVSRVTVWLVSVVVVRVSVQCSHSKGIVITARVEERSPVLFCSVLSARTLTVRRLFQANRKSQKLRPRRGGRFRDDSRESRVGVRPLSQSERA